MTHEGRRLLAVFYFFIISVCFRRETAPKGSGVSEGPTGLDGGGGTMNG